MTVTNASWDVTADTYIGLTGTEFAAVNVGDWASIYLDAATQAVYISQVTAVGALGVSITLSTTAKYGTKPAAGATGRSCKVGGPHASLVCWKSTNLGAGPVPASTRINVKQATYTHTASDTFSMAGATTTPFWIRGYNTTVGDCDADPTLAKPIIAYDATFAAILSGGHQVWSSLSVTGNRTGAVVTVSTAEFSALVRLRVENTSANAGAIAATFSVAGFRAAYCWFKTPTTATTCVSTSTKNNCYVGCVVENARWLSAAANDDISFLHNISLNSSGAGFLSTTGVRLLYLYNTVYNATGDGITWNTATHTMVLVGNALWDCGGWGINQSAGTNSNTAFRSNNSFWSNTSGTETGFGDSPSFFEQDEVAQPYTSATDMTPVSGALARAAGFAPGVFENKSFRSYVDIGAVQHQDSGGGGLLTHPGLSGGMRG